MPAQGEQSNRARVLGRLLVLLGAVVLGLALQDLLRSRLDGIAALAERDGIQARAELAFVFRVVGAIVFGATGVAGVAIVASARRASGSRKRLGMFLGSGVVLASLAGGALLWVAAAIVAACRA